MSTPYRQKHLSRRLGMRLLERGVTAKRVTSGGRRGELSRELGGGAGSGGGGRARGRCQSVSALREVAANACLPHELPLAVLPDAATSARHM